MKTPVSHFNNEKAMLEFFISKVAKLDPDLIVAHGLCSGMFDTLIDKIDKHKVNLWSRIGRFKKNLIPKSSKKDISFGGFWIPRQATIGRLLCDTFLTARELVRETNYNLTELARTQLGVKRDEFDPAIIKEKYSKKSEDLQSLIVHTEMDSYLTIQLLFKLAIIPLTKQLTNIAGNLWYRSLQNARAERNEWLLLHEFNAKNFICPDKEMSKKPRFDEVDENDNDDDKPGKRKKAAYTGGLVLDPKPGLYDKIVLLLDFNSLYPSIIQEYNLCFTTVDRVTTHNFNGEEVQDAKLDEVDVPDRATYEKDAILPGILKMLVEKRRVVKTQIKKEQDQGRLDQLDIKQKALKVTANSMYGCLGFSSSRFYAKAIAALITRKGRNALEATVKITTEHLNYNVVYGDTDSIMIDTGIKNLKEALLIGEEIKKAVNKEYKCLEIEIDGVFRSLLLLKKK
jgi:DNA polymerase alpha subunit A